MLTAETARRSRPVTTAMAEAIAGTAGTPGALLAMLRLGSAALPIGAFAYSQGLEQAVAVGAVHDAESAAEWITGVLESSVLSGDVPVLVRLCSAWQAADEGAVRRWSDFLYATRPTRELRDEERQLGSALFRLLARLGCDRARPCQTDPRATLASAFALAACTWELSAPNGALAYCFAWAEAQVGAATRLVPLGQSDAQRVLSAALACIDRAFSEALARPDELIFHTAPGQALLSAAHETQYSRLFRS
jgi:urease accessory protein